MLFVIVIVARMRIGIDARSLEGERTGVGRYLSELLRHFETLALDDVEFFLYFRSGVPRDFQHNPRFLCKKLPSTLGCSSNALFMHQAIPQAFKKDKIGAGFFPDYTAPLLLSVPYGLTLHDIVYAAQPKLYFWPGMLDKLLLGTISRRAAQHAKTIFAPSMFTKQEIIRVFRVPEQKILVTPEAAGKDFTPHIQTSDKEVAKRLGIHSRFIVFVGSIFTRRHIPACLEAFEIAAQNFPELQFLLAGRNRTRPFIDIDLDTARINKKLGREAVVRVPFIAPQDLPAVFRQASALVWISEYEGFGLPVLEALASGCPVITSKNASLPEVAGDAALTLEDPKDATALADALARILSDESLVRDLVSRGAEQAKKFSWDVCATRTLNALMKL